MNTSENFSKGRFSEHPSSYLQREIEQMTQNLEYEKRESSYLEEQIKLIQFEINSIPRNSKKSIIDLRSQISVMEKKLDLEVTALNKSKLTNKQIRSQINEYRLGKCAYKQSLNAIHENLDKTSKEAEERVKENVITLEDDEEQQEKILNIRARSANQISAYDVRISSLTSMLRSSRFNEKFQMEDKVYSAQSIDVISVLKSTSKFYQKYSVDKKRNLESYLKHINSLRSGFDSIKSISGINKVEDIVTSCIKSEEQNKQVLSYLNLLNAEIDLLEENFKNYQRKIQVLEGTKSKGQMSLLEFRAANEEHYKNLNEKMEDKKNKNNEMMKEINHSLPLLKHLFEKIRNINLKGPFSGKEIEEIEKLNNETVVFLLGNIEEVIMVLTIVADFKKKKEFSVKINVKEKRYSRPLIKELIEEKDLFDEPGIEEIKLPISVDEMKNKALMLYQNRKNFIKGKPNTPDLAGGRHSRYFISKENAVNRSQVL